MLTFLNTLQIFFLYGTKKYSLLYISNIGFFRVLLHLERLLKNKILQFIPLCRQKVRAMSYPPTTLDVEVSKEQPNKPTNGCGGKEWELSDRGSRNILNLYICKSALCYFYGYRGDMLKN